MIKTLKRWFYNQKRNRIFKPDFTLKNGRKLYFRLMLPEDEPLLHELRALLSDESLSRRFHVDAYRITPERVQQTVAELVQVDNAARTALMALYQDDMGEHIVGIARLARVPDDASGQTAEVAVIVRDDFHHQGLGRELLKRALRLAQQMGITKWVAYIQIDNLSALRLFRSLELPTKSHTSYGSTELQIALD
ncbi:MAG: GNAT family N-acetyltransferase [Caldilineaceae bacterium]